MQFTDTVSIQQLKDENMIKGNLIAIPLDPFDETCDVVWKNEFMLNDADYETIDEYFITLCQKK